MRLSLHHGVSLAAVLVAVMWRADFARASDDYNPDDDWKGPGWYEVFYSTGVYLIYSGPYAKQDDCKAYVNSLGPDFEDKMTKKYGPYGDEDNGWMLYCMQLNTKDEWHDMDQ